MVNKRLYLGRRTTEKVNTYDEENCRSDDP